MSLDRLRRMSMDATRLELFVDVEGTLVASGEIDTYTAPELAERLADHAVSTVDLADVSFIDSSGLRVLIEAHQKRSDGGGSLTLRQPSAAVQRLLEISGLQGLLDIV